MGREEIAMKKLFIMVALSITALAGTSYLQSCKKCECQDVSNPDCENYDPCYGKYTANFGFTYGSQWVTPESFFGIENYVHDKDSILQNNNRIKFTAHKIYDSVVWKLGSETITNKSFVRIFNNVKEGYYSCTMVGHRAKQDCIAGDDGIDTITKRWYMMPLSKMPIIGKYKVLFVGARDSTIVQVQAWDSYKHWSGIFPDVTSYVEVKATNVNTGHITLINFYNDEDTTASFDFINSSQMFSGHWMVFNDDPRTNIPSQGSFSLNSNNEVVARFKKYYFKYNPTQVLFNEYSFKGRKLP
jgi:hypothetical protein